VNLFSKIYRHLFKKIREILEIVKNKYFMVFKGVKFVGKSLNYFVFIDESGDPGKPYKISNAGEKIATGASVFYILSALPLNSQKLFLLEDEMLRVKNSFGYKREIKSNEISLPLYKKILNILNELNIKVYYRFVNKEVYKGKFAVEGNRRLHNIFDEYNLAKVVYFTIVKEKMMETDVVIDRTERRLLDGKFDNFNEYLLKKVNRKTIKRISYITHVNSEYVNAMQMADLVSGAIKNYCTGKNKDLKNVINRKLLFKIY